MPPKQAVQGRAERLKACIGRGDSSESGQAPSSEYPINYEASAEDIHTELMEEFQDVWVARLKARLAEMNKSEKGSRPRSVEELDLWGMKDDLGRYPISIPARTTDDNHKSQICISTARRWKLNPQPAEHRLHEADSTNDAVAKWDGFCDLLPPRHHHQDASEMYAGQQEQEIPRAETRGDQCGSCSSFAPSPSSTSNDEEDNNLLRGVRPEGGHPPDHVLIIGRVMTCVSDATSPNNSDDGTDADADAGADGDADSDPPQVWCPTVFVAGIDPRGNAEGQKPVWIIRDYHTPIAFEAGDGSDKCEIDVHNSIDRLRRILPGLDTEMTFDAAQLTESIQGLNKDSLADMGQRMRKTAGTWNLDIFREV